MNENTILYICNECGYVREKPSICPFCETPLNLVTRDEQREYQFNAEDAMRSFSDMQWYI